MVSNILPVPYDICYNESASDHMDHYPERFEAECDPCFSYGQDRHSRTVFVSVSHDMACSSGPDAFNAPHHCRLIHIAMARPAHHNTEITAYLIFLRVDTLDQVLAISETVLLPLSL